MPFELKPEPGNDKFAFTRERHREVALSTRAELDEVIQLACKDLGARRIEITKSSVYQYVSGRLDAHDKEWRDLVEFVDAKDWLKKLDGKKKGGAK